ncbi:TetR/AcrR family transcriptional regulator [Microbacterium karelineae]|uniref:TetR/AcrR family transcriptional regulator n=1 Tax=Microbacterium karelineae TaxID=2654283 RepID=UPI0012E9C723|nr:TetR/AcrR family transcriptional regulator [Microbacterium karelineae]
MSTSDLRYHHGDLQRALLDAADALLAERGSAALSLREVARRAGVSHNAPYHHFPDRIAVMKGLAERHMQRLLDRQKRAAQQESDPDRRLRAVAGAYIDYALDQPAGFGIVFDPEICVPGAPTAEMGLLIAENEALIAEVVADRLGDADPAMHEAAAQGAWALVHGLSQLIATGHLPRAAAETAIDGLSALLAAPGAAPVSQDPSPGD